MDTAPPNSPPRSRSTQLALVGLGLALFSLLIYRAYSPYWTSRPTDPTSEARAKPVDLNSADRAELLQLPGVGPSLADSILNHRQERGPFETVEELQRVHGVGGKTFEKLRPFISVQNGIEKAERTVVPVARSSKLAAGSTALDLNTATEAELLRLPRVGPVLAAAIIAARNQESFGSVDDLRRVRGIGAKTLEGLRPFVAVAESRKPISESRIP